VIKGEPGWGEKKDVLQGECFGKAERKIRIQVEKIQKDGKILVPVIVRHRVD